MRLDLATVRQLLQLGLTTRDISEMLRVDERAIVALIATHLRTGTRSPAR